jgi:diguanylate cyclase (GGDEF)-like protein
VEHGCFVLAAVGLLDEAGELNLVARAGRDEGLTSSIRLAAREDLPGGRGLTGEALRNQMAVICNDIEGDPRPVVARAELLDIGVRSLVILPLVINGQSVGATFLCGADRDMFDEGEMRLLREVAGDISFALDHITKVDRLDYLAYYDELTGLPNRSLFSDRLAQLFNGSEAEGLALLMGDVHQLRVINDSYGQAGGDAVLKAVAERLRQAVPQPATIGRLGPDDFGIILPGIADPAAIARLLNETVLPALSRPVHLLGDEIRPSLRFGVAVSPSDGRNGETLLANAEAALRRSAETGEGYLFYAPAMNERASERLSLHNRLLLALEREQFVLHYQPKVELRTRRIVGFEALIRWVEPDRGLVPPGEFIPLLEETGLIINVGRWALNRAIRDRQAWLAAGRRALPVAVNVSPVQLRQRGFVDEVRNALDNGAARMNAGGLVIEITESLFLEDLEGSIDKLKALKALGVGVSIDDFGTGYSSLRYIARLPVDSLKIDRSFVTNLNTNPNDMAIVSTVIALAHALDLRVVAEGVETDEQLKLLRLLKCDEIQGYLVSRPVPPDEAIALADREGLIA